MTSPKYNRTFHVPWSLGSTNDDKIANNIEGLLNTPIVVTEKMDGSNTSLETFGCYARTHSGPPDHPSFDGLKALHATVKLKIPDNFQLFGEWCFAKHSISYEKLPGYFLLFNVRFLSKNQFKWASWEEVEMWAEEIEVPTVPVLFQGKVSSFHEMKELVDIFMNQPSCCGGIREGVVIRVAHEFLDEDFYKYCLKCVRANHVQTSDHWRNQEIVRNKLKI